LRKHISLNRMKMKRGGETGGARRKKNACDLFKRFDAGAGGLKPVEKHKRGGSKERDSETPS